jgi:hypothetical protein
MVFRGDLVIRWPHNRILLQLKFLFMLLTANMLQNVTIVIIVFLLATAYYMGTDSDCVKFIGHNLKY